MLDNRKPFIFTMLAKAEVQDGERSAGEINMSTAKDACFKSCVVDAIPSEIDTREVTDRACEKDDCTDKKNIDINLLLKKIALRLDEISQTYKNDVEKMGEKSLCVAQQAIGALVNDKKSEKYVLNGLINRLLSFDKKMEIVIWCAPQVSKTLNAHLEKISGDKNETCSVVVKDNKGRLYHKDIEIEVPFGMIYHNKKKIIKETFMAVIESLVD